MAGRASGRTLATALELAREWGTKNRAHALKFEDPSGETIMKSYVFAALALGMFALASAASAQAPSASASAEPVARPAPMSANEAAGLPDLAKINRPAAEVSSKVDVNDVQRTPSFYEKSANGTEITEYRDKGKPVEINVRSNFGTRYQMSASPDTSPKVRDNAQPSTRLPSINLHY
jgi:hypothetical protein